MLTRTSIDLSRSSTSINVRHEPECGHIRKWIWGQDSGTPTGHWLASWAPAVEQVFGHYGVVYAKPAFGGATAVLRYLGRYTHRVAISNHRLVAFDGERVTFRWKDYAHDSRWRTMTLAAMEFLRRFIQHVLPRGFVRIRHFGSLASACRTARLAVIRVLLAQPATHAS